MHTFERSLLTLTAAAVLAAPLYAQTTERRANLTGGGGDNAGKCTIEVFVDGAAEVQIHGDRGSLRTLSGRPAQWRRFECSGPLPTSPSEFRFNGVDGRGKQELVQEPRQGRGMAVVRIQDTSGGAEGYTFDLVWRGAGFNPNGSNQPFGGRERSARPNDTARACQDTVRQRANQQYGLREIDFRDLNADGNAGRNERIMGTFDVRRGNDRDTYWFSCSVDFANGRIQVVEISQARNGLGGGRYSGRDDAISACRRAADQRIQRDGYRNVQFGSMDSNERRSDAVNGTATAQRGNNGRTYQFEVRCSVNLEDGNVRSIQVNRR